MLRLWRLKYRLLDWYYLKFLPLEKLERKICRLYPDGHSANYNKIKPLLEYRWLRLEKEFEWTPEHIEAFHNLYSNLHFALQDIINIESFGHELVINQ